MNTIALSSLRTAALAAALLLVPAIVSANDPVASDPAARILAASGSVPVQAAGPYVEVGSYRIHVWTKLGRPSATLADGTWLYRNFSVDDSAASGTLLVRFDHGRVSQLSLVSPRVETAMLAHGTQANTLVALK